MKKIYKLAIIAFLVMNSNLLKAQIIFQPEGKEDLIKNSLYIVNRGTQTIKFSLSLNRIQWQSFQLKARNSGNAWRQNSADFQVIYIKITSNSGNVEYPLKKKKRYQIYWNGNTGRWDVAELTPQR